MIVAAAIDAPVHSLFEYRAADGGASLVGRRVGVMFGGRKAVGVVLEERERPSLPPEKIKPLLEVYDDMPPLPDSALALVRFCAAYYHAPIGVACAAMLPALFRRPSLAKTPSGYRLTESGEGIPPRRTAARRVAAWLRDRGVQPAAAVREGANVSAAVLRTMLAEGWIARGAYLPPSPSSKEENETPPELTSAQKEALAVCEKESELPCLLFGDTGAGKTEIYLRLAQKALTAGGQALILTPEIHLTPQLESSFVRRLPGRRVCVLHSGLTDSERAHRWLLALRGEADVVLGTRLAVFTPMPKLKFIAVDEEHDDSYKQEEGLLFSARDVAVWRAREQKAALVCGSATPSLESYENARRGRYRLARMRTRAAPGAMQIDIAAETDSNYHGMSPPFLDALADVLRKEKQALVFVNRRGYSPGLCCRRCGWTAMCDGCDARMAWHRRLDKILCHRCGRSLFAPPKCKLCGGEMGAAGVGTQRIEEALNARFAPLKALRLDGDSLTGRDSFAALRRRIASGEERLLVGTQIIAKGHNFPKLSFIGILNSDAGLLSADFRAEERLLTLLRQVIGRGTRNPNGCRALIQTAQPEHPFYKELLADKPEECWRRLAKERQAAKWPPFSHCALLRASAAEEKKLRKFFAAAKKSADSIAAAAGSEVTVYAPAPSPVAKVARRIRWQLLAQSARRPPLHQFLSEWRQTLPRGQVRWSIDVDPAMI